MFADFTIVMIGNETGYLLKCVKPSTIATTALKILCTNLFFFSEKL